MTSIIVGAKKDLPYNEGFGELKNWVVVDGNLEMSKNEFMILQSTTETSSDMYLDGSFGWKNFSYNLVASLDKGTSYDIVISAKNGLDYLTFVFSKNKIRVQQVLDGATNTIYESQNLSFDPRAVNNIKLELSGDNINCFVNWQEAVKILE